MNTQHGCFQRGYRYCHAWYCQEAFLYVPTVQHPRVRDPAWQSCPLHVPAHTCLPLSVRVADDAPWERQGVDTDVHTENHKEMHLLFTLCNSRLMLATSRHSSFFFFNTKTTFSPFTPPKLAGSKGDVFRKTCEYNSIFGVLRWGGRCMDGSGDTPQPGKMLVTWQMSLSLGSLSLRKGEAPALRDRWLLHHLTLLLPPPGT